MDCNRGWDAISKARCTAAELRAVGFDLAPTAAARFDALRQQLGVSPEVESDLLALLAELTSGAAEPVVVGERWVDVR